MALRTARDGLGTRNGAGRSLPGTAFLVIPQDARKMGQKLDFVYSLLDQ